MKKGECEILYGNRTGDWQKAMDLVNMCTRGTYHNWVGGTLGYKLGTKNGRNVVKVLLERYEQE